MTNLQINIFQFHTYAREDSKSNFKDFLKAQGKMYDWLEDNREIATYKDYTEKAKRLSIEPASEELFNSIRKPTPYVPNN